MTGISYHPLYDPYHCLFRLSAILRYRPEIDFDIHRIKLVDFYLLVPSLIQKIRLSGIERENRTNKNLHNTPLPYQKLPASKHLFMCLSPIQDVAFRHQIGAGLIDNSAYKSGRFKYGSFQELPTEYVEHVEHYIRRNMPIFDFLIHDLAEIPTFGSGGLKDRTGLMDHRYDVT